MLRAEMKPVLVQVENLNIVARGKDGRDMQIVQDIGFEIAKGKVLALIGESGSGKSTIALALMGYTRRGCRFAGGSVRIGGRDILALSDASLREVRGNRICYVPQSAAASFNPSKTIMSQVIEGALIHGLASQRELEAKAIEIFRDLALPRPDAVGMRYPHEVSGGQLQRLAAAMALITDPELIIFDEPTTALDVTTQIEVLRLFKAAIKERGITGIYVTHDLPVVAQIADDIVVLRDGVIQDVGTTQTILSESRHEYTVSLLAAARHVRPAEAAAVTPSHATPLLRVENITAGYGPVRSDGTPAITVLKNVSLSLHKGRNLGVIGESGSGKSSLARVLAGLLPPTGGTVRFEGQELASTAAARTKQQLRDLQIVFQSADTALNPSCTVEQILGRPLHFYHQMDGRQCKKRIADLLDLVQMSAATAKRYPGELSGGQKQRVNLARALAAEPAVILCDEVTSALDTVVGAAVLDLLRDLTRDLGLTLLFISHDLSVVRSLCDDIVVLYGGRVVEKITTGALESTGAVHPYTELLLSSVPDMSIGWLEQAEIKLSDARQRLSSANADERNHTIS
jgi:peptide/nickel transport system ATP-binding protein